MTASFVVKLAILWGLLAAVFVVLALLRRQGRIGPPREFGALRFITASFGIILGFTTFFATQQYSDMERTVQAEATSVREVGSLVGVFPPRTRIALRQQLYCYAAAVIDDEWPAMRRGDRDGSPAARDRLNATYEGLIRARSENPAGTAWYSNTVTTALDVARQREQRLLLSAPRIPTELWFLIYLCTTVLIAYLYITLLFAPKPDDLRGAGPKDGDADAEPRELSESEQRRFGRRERVWTLAAVTIVLTGVVGVLAGLEDPIGPPFGIAPAPMEAVQDQLGRTIAIPPDTDDGQYCRAIPADVIVRGAG
jgi:hypothetical protein